VFGLDSAHLLLHGFAQQSKNGEAMAGSKHNREGNSRDSGEPDPGPYWRRIHRDWRFWEGALFMAAALAIYVLSGDLAWVRWNG
jgi:hypothetical protein